MAERAAPKASFPLPVPPFMGCAPLDQWFRLLFRPRPSIPPRYALRVGIGLVMSTFVTLLTLPERLLFALWYRLRPSPRKPLPGPVIILGYYRSGTTHLQYLLDCDPNLYSPKWSHVLSPQGFLFSWTVLRFIMMPFLARTRPQDNVAFGSDVPAEDDFALNNWALASTLPGRVMVPQLHTFYDRFHDLQGLTPPEVSRWRRIQYAFTRKLSLLAGRRRVLLKTPSHTARVGPLLDLFAGTTGVKFIHITRHPYSVLRSNIGLLQVMTKLYGLQDPLPPDEMEDYLVKEYLGTEESYLAASAQLAPGQIAEVRLQDLQADPIGELKRVYAELGLTYTEGFEKRVLDYLDATREYTPNVHSKWTPEQERRLLPPLEPLIKQFRHDEPPIPKKETPPPPSLAGMSRGLRELLAGAATLVTAAACLLGWTLLARQLDTPCVQLIWPAGIAIGFAALYTARRGTYRLGIWSGLVGLGTLAGAALLYAQNHIPGGEPASLAELWTAGVRDFVSLRTLFYSFMGIATAYRMGSQPQV